MAKTINYLTENNLLDYQDLKAKSEVISSDFSVLSKELKDVEKRLAQNKALQKNIVQFAKTKDVYQDYKKSGYSPKFKEENITEILLHQAAKNHFKELGLSKLPKMSELKRQSDSLYIKKKEIGSKYSQTRKEMQEILNAKANVEIILNMQNQEQQQDKKKEGNSL